MSDFKDSCLADIDLSPWLFRQDFIKWIDESPAIFQEFERRALKVRSYGIRHYSARTIVETIRHDTAIGELRWAEGKGDFKINNNFAADCARLFALRNPQAASLFEMRASNLRAAA